MKKNLGLGDRLLRLIAGAALLVIFLFKPLHAPWLYVVPILSAILVLTACAGTCLIYSLFGINTWQFMPEEEKD